MIEKNEYQNNLNIWTALFKELSIDKSSTIVDLCPGDDPKIELALNQYGFNGNLIVIDASEQSLIKLREQANRNIKYNFITIAKKLQDAELPKHNHIIGNHIIDDLISFEFCRRNSEDYCKLSEDVEYSRSIWNEIVKSPKPYEEFTIETVKCVSRQLSEGGYLIISQYPSKFERQHKFYHETAFCTSILDRLVESLSHNGSLDVSDKAKYAFKGIKTEVYEPKQWKILRVK